ncbi:response regulator [Elusimicrobiota bacterium]
MDKDSILKNKKLLKIFTDETAEHIQNIENGLVTLKDAPHNTEVFEVIAREAHTLKGSAKMMEFTEVSDIAHNMESLLVDIKSGKYDFTDYMGEVLHEGLGNIRELMSATLSGNETGIDIKKICEKIINAPNAAAGEKNQAAGRVDEDAGKEEDTSGQQDKKKEISKKKLIKKAAPISLPTIGDSVRVNVDKLDKLVNLSGEIETNRVKLEEREKIFYDISKLQDLYMGLWGRIKQQVIDIKNSKTFTEEFYKEIAQYDNLSERICTGINDFSGQFRTDIIQMFNYLHELYTLSMDMRLFPLSVVFDLYPYTVQQLAKEYGKKITLDISGSTTRLDKKIIDGIKDPLLHILRNAVAHGIEVIEKRKENNKSEEGTVQLKAYYEGDSVNIEVVDDGCGINIEKIKEKAVEMKLIERELVEKLEDHEVISFIFQPGFSTADAVDELSGRGIGMDVVRKNTEDLGGIVTVDSELGKGTRFLIQLPITLTTANALLVNLGRRVFGIPASVINTTVRVFPEDIKIINNKKAFVLEEEIIPVVAMKDVLDFKDSATLMDDRISLVIIEYGKQKIGFIVDEFLGNNEIVIKELDEFLSRLKYISGATILPRGEIGLMLHIPDIIDAVKTGVGVGGQIRIKKDADTQIEFEDRKNSNFSILVVDDAVTTRELERQILEAEGYNADVAEDGLIGLEKASKKKYDLIITDIQMPRMDGFEMVKEIRKKNKEVPIVLVTGLSSEEDRKRGYESGATAYFVKSSFDQNSLLSTVEKLLG